MEEKIMTLHPEGKQGVNISKVKYEVMRNTLLDIIGTSRSITFKKLTEMVGQRLGGNFEGSIGWYVTTVKLDLEARGEIERIPGSGPQRLRLRSN